MLQVTFTQINRVDSRLLVVESQIAHSTPNSFFGHNLCCKCPNESCEPILDIYVSITFQWYKEVLNPLSFWPLQLLFEHLEVHQDSNSQRGSSLGSVRVYSLTHSYTLGSMWHDYWVSLFAHNLATFCLGHEPKARVATMEQLVWFLNRTHVILELKIIKYYLHENINCNLFEGHSKRYCHNSSSFLWLFCLLSSKFLINKILWYILT